MKKQILKSLLWVFIGIVWAGLDKLAMYLVEMQYSTRVAPNQVDDDAAYTTLKNHNAFMNITDYVYFAGFVVIIYFIAAIWMKRTQPRIVVK
jgi:hypothetical protein